MKNLITSIKGQLVLAYSIMILLALGVVGFISISTARNAVINESEAALELLVDEKADFVEKEIERNEGILKTITQIDGFQTMDWNIQKDILERQVENSSFINAGVVDLRGNSHFIKGSISNFEDQGFIDEALAGEPALSEMIYSESGDEINLMFSVPIEENGQVVGALLGERDGYFLSEITDDMHYKKEGYGYVIDGAGTDIAHPNRDFVKNKNNSFELYENDKSLESVVNSFTRILDERQGLDQYSYEGEDFYVAYSPIVGTEWIAIITANSDEVLEAIPAMENKILIFAIIILLISIGITYLIGHRITSPIVLSVSHLEKIARLDISEDLPEELLSTSGEIGVLARSIESITINLRDIMSEIGDSSEHVAATSQQLTASSQQSSIASEEVARASEDIANGAGEQAVSTERGATMALDLEEVIKEDQRNMSNLYKVFEQIQKLVDNGLVDIDELDKITGESETAIKDIYEIVLRSNESSNKIGRASQMIADIADQTNLLALNAAIEAARAGEAGRGFAVVADEITQLANQSATTTAEIDKIVEDLLVNSEQAVNTMVRVREITGEQTTSVANNKDQYELIGDTMGGARGTLNDLEKSSRQIEETKNQILETLQELSAIAEENSAATEEVSASMEEQYASTQEISSGSEGLAQLAQDLQKVIRRMTV